ncbi:GNAT family N-acetyltransferase [Escherichia coli]|nr:GNAT family N-acetyltransferase [Escherichia coli]
MTLTIGPSDDLAACHAIRRVVFIEEQQVSEAEELDDLDAGAIHLLALDDGVPVGTARLLLKPPVGKIGRVAVLRSHRGTGLGAQIMQACLEVLRDQPGLTTAYLSAQTHALGFYEKLGFVAYGDEYPDAGIPHRDMECPL